MHVDAAQSWLCVEKSGECRDRMFWEEFRQSIRLGAGSFLCRKLTMLNSEGLRAQLTPKRPRTLKGPGRRAQYPKIKMALA